MKRIIGRKGFVNRVITHNKGFMNKRMNDRNKRESIGAEK